jgi:hypothetical protein
MRLQFASFLVTLTVALAGCRLPGLEERPDAADRVPSGYVRVHGEFAFAAGNPFPRGLLPELHIVCANPQADRARHNPYIQGSEVSPLGFSVLLKKGQTYSFNWVYEFGTEQRFAEWRAPAGPRDEIRLVLTIAPDGQGVVRDAVELLSIPKEVN